VRVVVHMAMAVALISAIFWQPFIEKLTIAGWSLEVKGGMLLDVTNVTFVLCHPKPYRGFARIRADQHHHSYEEVENLPQVLTKIGRRDKIRHP
jgi:hypothetical protein